jgi:hypothetical protein
MAGDRLLRRGVRCRTRVARRVAVLGFVVGGLAALSGVGQAGEYVVKYCQFGRVLQDWQPYRDAPGALTEDCAAGPGRFAASLEPSNAAGHSRVGWLLRWPAGIRPVYLRAQANRHLDAGTRAAEGGIDPYGMCGTGWPGDPCPSGQVMSVSVDRPVSEAAGAPGQTFWAGVGCAGSVLNLCDGASGSVNVMLMEVTWSDTHPPTGTANVDALVVASPGDPVRGARSIEYRAMDNEGSGVRRVEARVDGRPVAVSPEQCQPPYTSLRACPAGAIGRLTIDTAEIDDGTHRLEIVAVDVGGNDGILASTSIVTQNREQVGPGSDPMLRGNPNGSYDADDARLTAWWPSTGRTPSKSRRVQRRCKRSARYRRSHQVACRGRAPSTSLRIGYSSRKSSVLRGRLVAPSGKPVSGAALQLVATPTATGAAASMVQTVSTDATGRFSARVPVAGGSASYSVQWRSRARDTLPAATAELQRTVRASTTFAIKPRPVVYRGQRLELSGRLRGRTGMRQGTAVVIQAHAGKAWGSVKTVRARPDGRWSATYGVPRQLRGRYRFRAVVKPGAGYAYATGSSALRRVIVRTGH